MSNSTSVFATPATSLALKGYKVFPLAPGRKVPLWGSHGHIDASNSLNHVNLWARQHPNANVGVRPDPEWLVIDIDDPQGFRKWARDLGLYLPPTRTIKTRQGTHLYYGRPAALMGVPLLSAIKTDDGARLADVKTDKGFVVGPGSRVKDPETGEVFEYRVMRSKLTMALPDAWVDVLRRPERRRSVLAAGTEQGDLSGGALRLARLMAVKRPGDGRRSFFQWAVCEIHRTYGGDPRAIDALIDAGVAAGKDRNDLQNIAAWAAVNVKEAN